MVKNGVPESKRPKKNLTSQLKSVTGNLFHIILNFTQLIMAFVWVTRYLLQHQTSFIRTLATIFFNKDDKNNAVLYLRYVDNIFPIFRKNVLFENIHNEINK